MAYTTNSPSPDTYISEGEEAQLKTYVLPAWIYRAFTAKYNLVEIHEYAKLRDVLSLDDVAHLEVLRQQFMGLPELKLDGCYYTTPQCLFSGHGDREHLPISGRYQTEIAHSLPQLLRDERTQKEALSRLKTIQSGGDEVACEPLPMTASEAQAELKSYYRVVLLHNALYIIVEEGFLSHLQGKAEHLTFLTEVLKSAYAIAPVKVVNRSVWYRQYVMALQG